ncbi:putative RTC4-like domain containing protein [Lyophyllum shimeji]|uniref:Restriction of telomere capping protein 4 n=1 Tax=Lyophyllum shimeji TaxID=47721 RepID=A0A9P3PUV5_LYOSH|nr:putative RTC4-like domain containing protein [Lyophyllum shimeji]
MESLVANPSWNKAGSVNDPKLRMPTRPTANAKAESSKTDNSNNGSRRRGKVVEDLGSSFAKNSSSQGRKKPGSTSRRRVDTTDHESHSEDELDLLSSNHGSDAETSAVREVKKDTHTDAGGSYFATLQQKSNVLKKLKFTKTKRVEDDEQLDGFQPMVLKENGNQDASTSEKSLPSRPVHTVQTTVRRPRSPRRAPSRRSPSPAFRRRSRSQTPKASRENAASENLRPKPRPLGKRKASQQSVQAFPDLPPLHDKLRGSPARRATVSGPAPFPSIGLSPVPASKTMDFEKKPAGPSIKKPKLSDFAPLSPAHSPLHPSEFPSLELLGSQESLVEKTKVAGKRSVSEKADQLEPADFPMPSPPSESKKGRTVQVKKRAPTRLLVSSDESDTGESAPSSSLKAQPFPMSTQMLDSIGTPSFAGPSNLGKRSSPSGSDERQKKKRKDAASDMQAIADLQYEEEDSINISTPIDPATLCPYCDTPLPASPTPRLKRLLKSAEKKSRREPRPDNPLARNAPFAVFITVCQRHRFESEILPQAELKGWPKSIDWEELGERVRRMKGALRRIIDDSEGPGAGDDHEGLAESRLKARCVFWNEVMAEVKQKGSRAVAGVRGQFASFEKTQPGYYGELGSVIIHQTLYDLFPPTAIDPRLVAPLTPNEFVQRILVPEVGVRLIMEDMGLDESKVEEAVRILRESANYGVAMFPVDEGDEGDGVRSSGKLGVADSIVMERARKRRKELEADEQEQEEQREMEEEAEKQRKASKRLGKRASKKGKEKESDVKPPAPAPQARPRPRPVGKNASMSTVQDTDVEISSGVAGAGEGEGDTDVEVERPSHAYAKPQAPRNANDVLPDHTDATPRTGKVAKAPADTDIDLCSSSSSSEHDEQWDTGRMTKGRKPLMKTKTVAASPDGMPPPPSSSLTSSEYRSGVHHDSEEATPKPPGRSRRPESASSISRQTPPLLRARERKAKSNSRPTAGDQESHSWLLSDTTYSSMESITYKLKSFGLGLTDEMSLVTLDGDFRVPFCSVKQSAYHKPSHPFPRTALCQAFVFDPDNGVIFVANVLCRQRHGRNAVLKRQPSLGFHSRPEAYLRRTAKGDAHLDYTTPPCATNDSVDDLEASNSSPKSPGPALQSFVGQRNAFFLELIVNPT